MSTFWIKWSDLSDTFREEVMEVLKREELEKLKQEWGESGKHQTFRDFMIDPHGYALEDGDCYIYELDNFITELAERRVGEKFPELHLEI